MLATLGAKTWGLVELMMMMMMFGLAFWRDGLARTCCCCGGGGGGGEGGSDSGAGVVRGPVGRMAKTEGCRRGEKSKPIINDMNGIVNDCVCNDGRGGRVDGRAVKRVTGG